VVVLCCNLHGIAERHMQPYISSRWYMAAWAREIGPAPLARRLLDTPIVLFRDQEGGPVALLDRCPHRFAPLSLGVVANGVIRCGYHGLEFDAQGTCVSQPSGRPLPPRAVIRSYPVVERHGCCWIWFGNHADADASSIPEFSFHIDPAYRIVTGHSMIAANFELITDNLLDLTHTSFIHPGFGGIDWAPEVSFSRNGETLSVRYEIASMPPSEFTEAFLPSDGLPVRELDIMRWNMPASMQLCTEIGLAGDADQTVVKVPSSHIITPETTSKSHYFWASGAPVAAPITDDDHYEAVRRAFEEEDAPMLEAAQQRLEGKDFWELGPLIIEYDRAAVQARRMLKQALQREQRANSASAL